VVEVSVQEEYFVAEMKLLVCLFTEGTDSAMEQIPDIGKEETV
jgi:hypothetical protein